MNEIDVCILILSICIVLVLFNLIVNYLLWKAYKNDSTRTWATSNSYVDNNHITKDSERRA